MFEVSIDISFSAGHALRNYHGKCENVHGHNYKVRVSVEGESLDATGLLIDFVLLRQAARKIVDRFDHQFLNDLAPYDQLNPSAENLARHISEELQPQVNRPGVRLQAVTVWETDVSFATYRAPSTLDRPRKD